VLFGRAVGLVRDSLGAGDSTVRGWAGYGDDIRQKLDFSAMDESWHTTLWMVATSAGGDPDTLKALISRREYVEPTDILQRWAVGRPCHDPGWVGRHRGSIENFLIEWALYGDPTKPKPKAMYNWFADDRRTGKLALKLPAYVESRVKIAGEFLTRGIH